ncbi:hypothetical protein B0I35DRAFT_480206 [Stachybotrys elegans]|uniref:Uncharacterized protein n=1 Tax=Stachybotrys elegans TaxID=80388 RepID=A0A8K0SPF1_9HYPO|nr:hypothetical protein B0I35DRAFT_480206 [Stachybotrys elegans]
MIIYRALIRGSAKNVPTALIRANWQRIARPACRYANQQRCYAKISSPKAAPSKAQTTPPRQEPKQQAKNEPKPRGEKPLPERLLIYHAGTGRTTFLAMVKVTTLFLGAFFIFMVVPAYAKDERPAWEIAGIAAAGFVPALFVTYTTAPFVTHILVHLPPSARISRVHLERFVRNMPSTTQLTVTTMSAISKPRYSTMMAGDLVPVARRFGLVNYVRDTAAENANRRWFMFPAVRRFFVQEHRSATRQRYQKKTKGEVESWVWEAVKEKIQRKAAATAAK